MSGNWVGGISDAIAKITGEDHLRQAVEDWQQHARRTSVVVAVHGPYDSGKSTLIKRILVEDGTGVPDWLAVSGRRETLSVSSVASQGIIYVDTPGTAGGNPEHDALAAEAVRTADVVVLVITPQLLAEDAKWIRSFTAGTYYSTFPLPLFPDGSLLLMIAQSDTAGVDPVDSPDGFRALCRRKQQELDNMLALGQGESLPKVHIVSADPYGQVAGDPEPEPGDYVAAAEWDGVTQLRADLGASRERLDELRAAARIRYWCLAGKQTADAAGKEIVQLEPILEEAESRRAHRSQLGTSLTALDEAAVADLQIGLANELGGLVSMAGTDDSGLRTEAERRLQERLESWYATYTRKMGELAAEVDAELDVERVRPASRQFDAWVRDLMTVSRTRGQSDNNIPKLGESTGLVFKGAFWMKYGMSVARAKDELGKVDKAGSVTAYVGSEGAVIKTEEAVETIKKRLPQVEAAATIATAVVEYAPLAFNLIRDHRATAKEQKQREDLQARITKVASQLEEQVLGGPDQGWRGAVAAMREQIRADPLLEPVVMATRTRITELEAARSDLLALLSSKPPSPTV
jgi:hypothetical protein